ncbi:MULTISPECIES: hypothetical protein [unclassified Paraflavitalea]|uniref:hypothetical protein n=1 Tax=unclassified Paraflavitalea TaxID=2798305 RepID=UPI003D3562A4
MKKLIFLIPICALSFQLKAQVYDSTKVLQDNNAYGYSYKNMQVRGMFKLFGLDTTKLAVKDSNAISVYRGNIYVWTGYYWKLSSGAGSGGGSFTPGYGLQGTSTVSIDTFNFRKVDTIFVINDSTIGFRINGISFSRILKGGSRVVNINGLTGSSQGFSTGTSGNDFNISSSSSTHIFNIPNADTAARGLITAARQQIGGSKLLTGTYTPSAKLSYNIAALGNHFATANNDTLVGVEVNPIFNALSFTGVLNYGIRSWPLQNLIGPIRTFSSTGNTYIGSNPVSTTDGGYKLDVGGSIRGQLIRLNGPIGYGTNILEFTLNGNTTPIAAINNFGIWNISNGGTNTVAANTGVIGTLGQNTSSILLGSQVNTFGITQWTGTAGTSNHTSLAGPFIIVPNGSGGTFSGLSIGGTQTAGVLTSGYLLALEHWSNSGVLAMGNTSAVQKYTVVDGRINVFVDQPNKTLEGYVWRPNITGSVALANNRAFISAPGANHGFGTLTPNNKAIAEFSDTTRGILPTRMTAAQASALSLGTGEAGMYIYVSTTNGTFPAPGFYYWSGTAWVAFSNTTTSGTYTPTFFTGTNTTSVSSSGGGVFYYVRTGNLVEVTGTVSASSTSTGAADFNVTIPIASDFTSIGDAQGLAINSTNGFGGNCSQNISADRVLVNYNANTGSNLINLKFTYIIR